MAPPELRYEGLSALSKNLHSRLLSHLKKGGPEASPRLSKCMRSACTLVVVAGSSDRSPQFCSPAVLISTPSHTAKLQGSERPERDVAETWPAAFCGFFGCQLVQIWVCQEWGTPQPPPPPKKKDQTGGFPFGFPLNPPEGGFPAKRYTHFKPLGNRPAGSGWLNARQ